MANPRRHTGRRSVTTGVTVSTTETPARTKRKKAKKVDEAAEAKHQHKLDQRAIRRAVRSSLDNAARAHKVIEADPRLNAAEVQLAIQEAERYIAAPKQGQEHG